MVVLSLGVQCLAQVHDICPGRTGIRQSPNWKTPCVLPVFHWCVFYRHVTHLWAFYHIGVGCVDYLNVKLLTSVFCCFGESLSIISHVPEKKQIQIYLCVLLCCRQECKKLREELREDHEEDKASALSQLAQSKEQEMSSARESWQRKVEDLLEQVPLLPTDLCTAVCVCMCACVLLTGPLSLSLEWKTNEKLPARE